MVLKPCASDWDSNPRSQDSNPAKTRGLPTEIIHLVLGLNEAQVLDVSSQKEFSERGFPGGAVVRNPPDDAGVMGSIPGPGRSHMLWSLEKSPPAATKTQCKHK